MSPKHPESLLCHFTPPCLPKTAWVPQREQMLKSPKDSVLPIIWHSLWLSLLLLCHFTTTALQTHLQSRPCMANLAWLSLQWLYWSTVAHQAPIPRRNLFAKALFWSGHRPSQPADTLYPVKIRLKCLKCCISCFTLQSPVSLNIRTRCSMSLLRQARWSATYIRTSALDPCFDWLAHSHDLTSSEYWCAQ